MDERSVTRPARPPALAIVADEGFCAQAAAVLGCEEQPMRDAFIGEPAEEVLEMVRWALSHQGDEGFDAEVLTAWAHLAVPPPASTPVGHGQRTGGIVR